MKKQDKLNVRDYYDNFVREIDARIPFVVRENWRPALLATSLCLIVASCISAWFF